MDTNRKLLSAYLPERIRLSGQTKRKLRLREAGATITRFGLARGRSRAISSSRVSFPFPPRSTRQCRDNFRDRGDPPDIGHWLCGGLLAGDPNEGKTANCG